MHVSKYLLYGFIVIILGMSVFIANPITTATNATPDQSQLNQSIIVVCPSGTGDVVCEFRFESERLIAILNRLCARGILPAPICAFIDADASVAQVPATCPVLVNFNLAQAADFCSDMDRNYACYGASRVLTVPTDVFTGPGDVTELTGLIAISAGGYDLREALYGVAAAYSHASLHLGTTGSLRMLIFGDVRVENGIDVLDAVRLPDEPIAVTVNRETSLYQAPDNGNGPQQQLGQVAAGSDLLIDIFTADATWARVLYMSTTVTGQLDSAWIETEALNFPDDYTPVDYNDTITPMRVSDQMQPNGQTPMQAFYFTPGPGAVPVCAPELGGRLVLQAPRGIETRFQVNDVPLRIMDTVELLFVRADEDGDGITELYMELRVVSGMATLDPESDTPRFVAPGYAARIQLDEQVYDLGADNTANDYRPLPDALWGQPFPVTTTIMNSLIALENLPVEWLNQAIDAPFCAPESEGENCIPTYDMTADDVLVNTLCESGHLSEQLTICLPQPLAVDAEGDGN